MKQRFLHFDIIKGIAILFVLLDHVAGLAGGYIYDSALYPMFHSIYMPMFILVSGYFSARALELSSSGIHKYWKNKFTRLLLPLLFLPLLMNWIDKGFSYSLPISQWLGKYWFTYVLFLLFVIFYIFRLGFQVLRSLFPKLMNWQGTEVFYFLGSLVAVRLGVKVLESISPEMEYYLQLNRITFLYKYLVLGYFMAIKPRFERFMRSEFIMPFAFFIFGACIYSDFVFDYEVLNGHLITLSGLVVVYYLSYTMAQKTSLTNKCLGFLGKESLPIYLTHYFFLPYLPWAKTFLNDIITNKAQLISWEIWIAMVGILMTLVPTLIVIRIIKSNKYLAFLFYGEKLT